MSTLNPQSTFQVTPLSQSANQLKPLSNWKITSSELQQLKQQFTTNTLTNTTIHKQSPPASITSSCIEYSDSDLDLDELQLDEQDEIYYQKALFNKQNIRKQNKQSSKLSQMIKMNMSGSSSGGVKLEKSASLDTGCMLVNSHVSDPSWGLTKIKKGKLIAKNVNGGKDSQTNSTTTNGKNAMNCWSDVHSSMIW